MYLNLSDVAAHDAEHDARSPAPRCPRAHGHTGRRSRQPVAYRPRKTDDSALKLSWPKRDTHVAARQRRQLEREGLAAGQVQTRSGSGDEVERRVNLFALLDGNEQRPADEVVAVTQRSYFCRRMIG